MTRPVFARGTGTSPRGPEGPRGPASTVPGPPGYNATGAAQDQQSIADYIAQTAGPNPVATALSASIAGANETVAYVSPEGDDDFNGLSRSTPKRTIAAAMSAIGPGVLGRIELSPGDNDAGSGLSFTGYQLSVVGPGKNTCRVVTTAPQVGPVLDFSGVGYSLDGVEIGGFTVHGDNTAGTSKQGLRLGSALSNTMSWVHDIAVRYTGGACFDLGITELVTFSRLLAYQPVGAVANDVPYMTASGAFNGNTLEHIVLLGTAAPGSASCGVSGAVVISDDGTYSSELNHMEFLPENIRVPSGGTIVSIEGSQNIIEIRPFDCSKLSGATGTSHLRLNAPAAQNSGGNQVVGIIPGGGDGAALDIEVGVDVRQSRNVIAGVKGYRGANVSLSAGVTDTTVVLHGAQSGASDAAVLDNSGNDTNTYLDHYTGTGRRRGTRENYANPKNPVWGADIYKFATTDGAKAFTLEPQYEAGMTLPDHSQGLPAASVAYRGKLALKLGGPGVADRLVLCRKDAADAYAWVDLF